MAETTGKPHPAGGRCCDPLMGKCPLRELPAPHYASSWYGKGAENKHCRACHGYLGRAEAAPAAASPASPAVGIACEPWEELNSTLYETPRILGMR